MRYFALFSLPVFLLVVGCGTSGSGTPTKTGTGAAVGAGAGAAIGSAVGGEDGWWIGALTGAALGGATGRAVGEADEQRTADYSTQSQSAYGIKEGATVRSPYSDYTVSIGGRTAGETVYDPNSERYFIIP
ncbi:MAG: glycine zipper 2TM domain-containing protein [Verrucomicrobiota bacterium]